MNVLFFLTPKNKISYISDKATVRQAIEKMEHHGYTAMPILDENGKYVGTVTDGDIMWAIKDKYDMSLKNAENIPIVSITRKTIFNSSVTMNTQIEDLIQEVMRQNFVPVTTDEGILMGIVTRKTVLDYFYKKYNDLKTKLDSQSNK